MINMTKGEFLRMLTRLTSECNEEWPYARVRQFAEEMYRNSFPDRSGLTDRFFLQGYTVLLDQDLDFQALADPVCSLDVNFLLPKRGIELYLQSECRRSGFDPDKAQSEVQRILRALSQPRRRRAR